MRTFTRRALWCVAMAPVYLIWLPVETMVAIALLLFIGTYNFVINDSFPIWQEAIEIVKNDFVKIGRTWPK